MLVSDSDYMEHCGFQICRNSKSDVVERLRPQIKNDMQHVGYKQNTKKASTPHKKGARVGRSNVSGLKWSVRWGKQGTKDVQVGDLRLFKVIARGQLTAVRASWSCLYSCFMVEHI